MNAARILVVDDDPDLRQLLQAYLGKHGYEVRALPDTAQLERTLERYAPQLVVLDWMMPGEDGISACRRLRANDITVPVIMLTARDETVDRIIGLQTGADDYLCKPFDPANCWRGLRRYCVVRRWRHASGGKP